MHEKMRTVLVCALVLPSLFLLTLASCANPAEAPIRAAFNELSGAIIAADSERLGELAPHLVAPGSSEALSSLASVLASKPRIRIRLLDTRTALVHLESSPPLDLPFERDPAGNWVLATELRRTQHFDIIPAN